MTNEEQIASIQADVDHCRAVFCEKEEPCYHCKQKQFLLDQIKTLNDVIAAMAPREPQVCSDPDGWGLGALATIVVPEATPEKIAEIKQQFQNSINEVTHSWKMPIYPVATITPEQLQASSEEANTCPGCHRVTCEPGCRVKSGTFIKSEDHPLE